METKNRANMIIPLFLFLLLGAVFAGNELIPVIPENKGIHQDCLEYDKDEDGDGSMGMIEDQDCHDYPYIDGLGETTSYSIPPTTGLNPPYQTYWDLSVDFTRFFIDYECSGNLNGCLGTNFDNEVNFYCWFDQNVMSNDWYSIFDRAFNQILSIPDDGSMNTYQNVCMAFPSYGGSTLPDMGTQEQPPIAENPSGSQFGGGQGNK